MKFEIFSTIGYLIFSLILSIQFIIKLKADQTEFPFQTVLYIIIVVLALLCSFSSILKLILLVNKLSQTEKGPKLEERTCEMQTKAGRQYSGDNWGATEERSTMMEI